MKRCYACEGFYPDDMQTCTECGRDLVDSRDYEQKRQSFRQQREKQAVSTPLKQPECKAYFPNQAEPSQVSCPKCNSTQIQMVQRKWSLLTGFFTNKVDRVCVKCKHKF